MTSSYVPPPFPFPEAWPQLFRSQQTTWLTPSAPWPPAAAPFGCFFPSAAFPGEQSEAHNGASINSSSSSSSSSSSRNTDISSSEDEDSDGDEEEVSGSSDDDDGGEFVYGYVLSDEWRGRFRSSQRARQQKQKKQQQQHRRPQAVGAKKRRQQQHATSMSELGVRDLQREFAAAKQREAGTRRPLPAAADSTRAQEVRRLEALLNLRFDELCDAFTPVVWPHD